MVLDFDYQIIIAIEILKMKDKFGKLLQTLLKE
jgi:hypothetical protein